MLREPPLPPEMSEAAEETVARGCQDNGENVGAGDWDRERMATGAAESLRGKGVPEGQAELCL